MASHQISEESDISGAKDSSPDNLRQSAEQKSTQAMEAMGADGEYVWMKECEQWSDFADDVCDFAEEDKYLQASHTFSGTDFERSYIDYTSQTSQFCEYFLLGGAIMANDAHQEQPSETTTEKSGATNHCEGHRADEKKGCLLPVIIGAADKVQEPDSGVDTTKKQQE